ARILYLCHLMTAIVHHAFRADDEAVLFGKVIHLSARIGMREGNLNGFNIQFFCKFNGAADRLTRFTRQTENEISVDHQAKLLSVLGKLAGAVHRSTLLDVLEYLRIA